MFPGLAGHHWTTREVPDVIENQLSFSVECYGQILNHVQLFVIQWTVAHQAPLSMGFSRQEYWSGLPLLQGVFPTQGLSQVTYVNLLWQVGSLPLVPPGKPVTTEIRSKNLHS